MIRASVTPSAKYPWLASLDRLLSGKTASDRIWGDLSALKSRRQPVVPAARNTRSTTTAIAPSPTPMRAMWVETLDFLALAGAAEESVARLAGLFTNCTDGTRRYPRLGIV